MAEGPYIIMQIPSNKFLSRWLHGEILDKNRSKIKILNYAENR